jgi:hypothetical protein
MAGLKVRFSQSAERRNVYDMAFKAEVVEASGMSGKIFVYHQSPVGPTGNTFSEFSHVASPVELQEIPEDAATSTIPWFRTDKLVVWMRCFDDLVTAKQMLVDDIETLVRSIDVLSSENDFVNQTDVVFGDVGAKK